MSESNFFADLKHSLEHAKDTALEIEHVRTINLGMVITDGRDDYLTRYAEMDRICSKLKAEVMRVYLYELKSTLLKDLGTKLDELDELEAPEEEKEEYLIQALQEHSNKIRELKQENTRILLEDGFRQLLMKIRSLRKVGGDESSGVEKKDLITLADFFLDDFVHREDTLRNDLIELIKEVDPQFIYSKPPLLHNREVKNEPSIGKIEKGILQNKSDGTWVYFEGNTPLDEVEHAVCLIFGGQDEGALLRNAQAVLSVVPDAGKKKITYLGFISNKTLKMALMVSDEETEDSIRQKIETRLKDQFRRLRLLGKAPEIMVEFGEIESDLTDIIREIKGDIVFINPKVTQETRFDESAADAAELLLSSDVSVFFTY